VNAAPSAVVAPSTTPATPPGIPARSGVHPSSSTPVTVPGTPAAVAVGGLDEAALNAASRKRKYGRYSPVVVNATLPRIPSGGGGGSGGSLARPRLDHSSQFSTPRRSATVQQGSRPMPFQWQPFTGGSGSVSPASMQHQQHMAMDGQGIEAGAAAALSMHGFSSPAHPGPLHPFAGFGGPAPMPPPPFGAMGNAGGALPHPECKAAHSPAYVFVPFPIPVPAHLMPAAMATAPMTSAAQGPPPPPCFGDINAAMGFGYQAMMEPTMMHAAGNAFASNVAPPQQQQRPTAPADLPETRQGAARG